MTPVIDIVAAVVTAMKPTVSATIIAGPASPYSIFGFTNTAPYFVGQKVKVIGVSPVVTSYCTVTEVGADYLIVSTSDTLTTGKANNNCTLQPVIGWHYGHPQELVNRFKEMTAKSTVKKEMFPAVCLLLDIEERMGGAAYDREAALKIVIITDTRREFSSVDRKTYSFDAILQPIYERLMQKIAASTSIAEVYPDHNKIDRYFWGREGLYGNTGNIFNDFIDAIEIDNLIIHTLKTC